MKTTPLQGVVEAEIMPPCIFTVNINGVSVERLRSFGDAYLGLLLWNKLGLADFCRDHIPSGREDVPWSVMAAILVLARFCAPSSELQIAESWYDKTALDDMLGVAGDKINDDRLYRALDALLSHKDALCLHLQKRYGELFGSTFDFLFYDITSTYFEGTAKINPRAKRGYSRDGRPDCPQVCIGLVASREGLPLAFEIFDGNRSDVTTTKDMVQIMEKENAILNRFVTRLESKLDNLAQRAEIGKTRNKQNVERRIGRLLEQNSRAASLFNVTVTETGAGKDARLSIHIKKNEEGISGRWRPAAVTSCAPTGQRLIPRRYGTPTFSSRKWKTLSASRNTTWGCGRSSTKKKKGRFCSPTNQNLSKM